VKAWHIFPVPEPLSLSRDYPLLPLSKAGIVALMGKPKDSSNVPSEYLRRIGAKGGVIGGKKRWEGKSAAEISTAMKRVAAARKKLNPKAKPKRSSP
jgi:hypothetical protein